jgi:hypothetical protein
MREYWLALVRGHIVDGRIPMSTLLDNNKPADRNPRQAGILWLFAITTTLVLALAGFVGIVF